MIKQIKGFTLIELLIVIAILGTLAVVVLLALNPIQQLARARDGGRTSGVAQLGHSMEAYATSHSGQYVTSNLGTWIQQLESAGEISTVPSGISYSVSGKSTCATNNDGGSGFCYKSSASSMIVYSTLESQSQDSNCTGTDEAYAVYSSTDGRGGVVCGASEPNNGAQNFVN